uniref:Avirulence protein S-HAC1Cala2 n=1 Tax=Hyaloperonospora arabidopsidis TaxID=272952 RepID=A0A2D0W2K9_HYAAB|nr:avirulence protein S-HAC1Cala2 [Hyaloperonospora arabidopsidis]
MRIYSTELLAAVAFVACLSRCSTSGSKTVRPDVPSSGHPDGHEDDISDDTAHRNDKEESEARMPLSGEMSALMEKLQAAKRPESSGKLLQELDLTLRMGKENAPVVAPRSTNIEKIIEQLEASDTEFASGINGARLKTNVANINADEANINADDEKQSKVRELVKACGDSDDGYTKLASALRKAKADGLNVAAVENEMLEVWKVEGVRPDSAFDFLELDKLLERGGLTDDNVALFDQYIKVYNRNKKGGRSFLHSTLLAKLEKNISILLQMIAAAGEKSKTATTVLMHFIRGKLLRRRHNQSLVGNLVKNLLKAEISESVLRHILLILREVPTKSRLHEEYLSGFTAALEKELTSSTKSLKRKVDTALRVGPAPARKKPASKGQKITGLSIWR